jgi:hypothetical protein
MESRIDKMWDDFYEWPKRWKGFPEDVPYGEGIIEIYRPFVEELLSRYSPKTINRHLDNLWLLGGELIRKINMNPELRKKIPMDLLLDNVDEAGGPYCRHLDSEEQMRAYEATCRKLSKFLRERNPNGSA